MKILVIKKTQSSLFPALMLDLVVVCVFKAAIRRSRPRHNVMDMMAVSVDKFSFPSGHTTRAAFMALFMVNHVLTCPVYIALTYVWAVSVSVSRVLLGRHHVLDVLCGFIIGVLSYCGYARYMWIPQSTCLYYLNSYFGHMRL